VIWNFIAFAATLTIYEFYRAGGRTMSFGTVAGMEFSQFLAYVPVTPLAFLLALRFPFGRGHWLKETSLHFAGGLAFDIGHLLFRSFTPFGYWDPKYREWSFAFWDPHTHAMRNLWLVGNTMFLSSVVDDIVGAYIPIVIIAHAFMYYRRFHERELQATRLEEQLANARLQTLKNQLQPHFLFNTLHSISALMLTDVLAADRMMTSLSDLLRMSLENDGVHLTSLNREIEFVETYLSIEKARFEDRLRVVLNVAPECLDAQVPHLLLQPLVENAIRHGISKLSEGGLIRIVASRDSDGDLEILVSDNGPGPVDDPEKKSKPGLGLRITRERLSALYGDRQSCEFRSFTGRGAEVYLRLPFHTLAVGAEAAAQGSLLGVEESR